jgi:predicted Zn-dependent peptidase
MSQIKISLPGNSSLIGTMVPVGSRNEPDQIKGISHLLEHMMFKGTTTRDKNEIKKILDKYGAKFNAWTSEEETFYYSIISNKYADEARDVIEDMVNNSIFPEDELEKEKQVVLQELEMYQDNPQSFVFELAQSAIFKEGSGLRIPIIGTRESVSGITRDVLDKYYKDNYKQKIQLTVGQVDRVEKPMVYLSNRFSQEEKAYTTEDYVVSRSGINQANMVLTGLIHLNSAEDHFNLSLLDAVMNGFAGRLFDVIREQNHLVYHVGFYYHIYSCGTVQYWCYAGLSSDKIGKAQKLMKEQLTTSITKDELDFAKNKWLGSYSLDLDNKLDVGRIIMGSIQGQYYYDLFLRDYKFFVDRVSVESINAFMKKCDFANSKLVAIVPQK